nr:ADP-ribosylglycohydrolase family protein [Prevotella pallens]
MLAVVNEAGDADTNVAVACVVLGAKFGYNTIPQKYIDGLRKREYLARVADDLIAIFS